MGILNITNDSFYAGSRFAEVEKAVEMAGKMLEEGATILDIGGYSSRPGALDIPQNEEADRVLPVIETLVKAFPDIILSVDTFRSGIASRAIKAGASIINDISSGDDDPEMIATVSALQVPYIAMHKKGKPQDMQDNPQYGNVALEVTQYLIQKSYELSKEGIRDIIWDPGFGFGKTIRHNYQLLNHFSDLTIYGYPVLAGLSRKSMIWKTLNQRPEDALNGSTALHMVSLMKNASILRVHDVKEAVECIQLYLALKS